MIATKNIKILLVTISLFLLLGFLFLGAYIYFFGGCAEKALNVGNIAYGFHMENGEVYRYYNFGSDGCELGRDIVAGANSDNFVVLSSAYAKDNNTVFYFGYKTNENFEILSKADVSTFKVLEGGGFYNFSEDKNGVFFENEKIVNVDKDSFVILDSAYSKDNQYVYWHSSLLVGVDSNTFKVLNSRYAKDDERVFYLDINILEADSPTFEVITNSTARDKNFEYVRASRKVN